jgi:hypothetical protein
LSKVGRIIKTFFSILATKVRWAVERWFEGNTYLSAIQEIDCIRRLRIAIEKNQKAGLYQTLPSKEADVNKVRFHLEFLKEHFYIF